MGVSRISRHRSTGEVLANARFDRDRPPTDSGLPPTAATCHFLPLAGRKIRPTRESTTWGNQSQNEGPDQRGPMLGATLIAPWTAEFIVATNDFSRAEPPMESTVTRDASVHDEHPVRALSSPLRTPLTGHVLSKREDHDLGFWLPPRVVCGEAIWFHDSYNLPPTDTVCHIVLTDSSVRHSQSDQRMQIDGPSPVTTIRDSGTDVVGHLLANRVEFQRASRGGVDRGGIQKGGEACDK